MSLYFPNGRDYISQEFPVATSAVITAEGQALVADTTAGVFGVKPSAGVTGEKFVGVAVSHTITINTIARVEEAVVPSTLVVNLGRTPNSGTLSVYDKTAGAVVPATGGSNWSLTGKAVTLPAGTLGHELTFYFKYNVTLNESRALQGDQFPGGPAGVFVGQVGVIKNGSVFTSEFDTTVNWNDANPTITTGANGQFTIGGNGPAVNGIVVAVPSATSPYLGINLSN